MLRIQNISILNKAQQENGVRSSYHERRSCGRKYSLASTGRGRGLVLFEDNGGLLGRNVEG